MKYKRIMLKLSGEVLSGNSPIDFDSALSIARNVKTLHDMGCQIGIVIGGGNIWRGRSGGNMDRNQADNIGMLATAMNSLTLEQAFIDLGVPVKVMSAVNMELFMDSYSARHANAAIDEGKIVIFACGTGSPFFSTDTAAALRAAQIHADALLLAKAVDGVYTADPKCDANARRYRHVSYDLVIERNLHATDLTAISFCREFDIPMVLFSMESEDGFIQAVNGVNAGTVINSEPGFDFA